MTAPVRRRGLTVVGLAGWLFADLLLVLALVGLASMPAPPHRAAQPPHPTATPSPTHSLGQLESQPELWPIAIDAVGLQALGQAHSTSGPAADTVVADVNHYLATVPRYSDGSTRRVGLVLVRVYEPLSQLGLADDAAAEVSQVLLDRVPAFAGALHEDVWNGSGAKPPGSAELEVYFYG